MTAEDLVAERLVAGGEALARRADGRVAFLVGALPGERVRVEWVAQRADYARGVVTEVLEASAQRVVPPCPHVASGCGGCGWQHLVEAAQREAKRAIVVEALVRTGRWPAQEAEALVVAGEPLPAGSRRTTVRMTAAAGGRLGFRRAGSREVVATDPCLVAHPLLNELIAGCRVRGEGDVTLRCSVATGERGVWAHARERSPRRGRPGRAHLQGLPEGVVTGASARLVEHVEGAALRVSMASFFQPSPSAAAALVRAVRAQVEAAAPGLLARDDAVMVDAYGGVGLFAATLPAPAARAVVVESGEHACADARHNLRERAATVVHARVEQWRARPADLVVADPARSGLGRAGVAALVAADADVLTLVSCDPVAGARDARLLADAGYAPREVRVLDLFPHTPHVETVATFVR
jgi:23S rRNA (uracil1939-C5)-methyltransferase